MKCKLPKESCPYQSCMGTGNCQFKNAKKNGNTEWKSNCGKNN